MLSTHALACSQNAGNYVRHDDSGRNGVSKVYLYTYSYICTYIYIYGVVKERTDGWMCKASCAKIHANSPSSYEICYKSEQPTKTVNNTFRRDDDEDDEDDK